ncbi:MAG: ARMT1-like domain-containing protein [bacterium]|nr:ARMT1-like domain-containing protein [bacterium]
MLTNEQLHATVSPLFDTFLKRLRRRLSGNVDLSWFVAPDSQTPYKPDYFELGQYGQARMQAAGNSFLSKSSYSLWRRLAWPRIFDTTYEVMRRGYYAPFLCAYQAAHPTLSEDACRTTADKLFWQLKRVLLHYFYEAPPFMHRATFTELFLIINESLLAIFTKIGLNNDVHRPEKYRHHEEFLFIYNTIREELFSHHYCHDLLAFLAARANWMDILEDSMNSFKHGFRDEINGLLDHSEDLFHQHQFNPNFHQLHFREWTTGTKKSILYELDNSGEVYFDLLLIEWLLKEGHSITVVAKRSPALNDIMVTDLNHILSYREMAHFKPHIASGAFTIIDNGCDGVGKQPHHIHKAYKTHYKAADLHIIKGQGQFHAMPLGTRKLGRFSPVEYRTPVLYMMGVKAPIIWDCLRQAFSTSHCPPLQSLFCYFYNPKDPRTFPK